MRTKRKIPTKKAGAVTPTKMQNYQKPYYPQDGKQSRRNLKNRLGQQLLLLLLAPLSEYQQQRCWRAFESTLRQYASTRDSV